MIDIENYFKKSDLLPAIVQDLVLQPFKAGTVEQRGHIRSCAESG